MMPMEWRESCGEEAWISSFLFKERCREEEEEEEMEQETVSLSCCKEHELGTSIFRVSLDSRDLSLSFIAFNSNWVSIQWNYGTDEWEPQTSR